MRALACLLATALLAAATPARAGFAETAPEGVFLLEERLLSANVRYHWSNEGERGPLLPPIVRYEPGGGLQGNILSNAQAHYTVLVNMLTYGITSKLTAIVAVPVPVTL